jgi:hypothetical protein
MKDTTTPVEIVVAESKRMEALLECAKAVNAVAQSLAAGATHVNIRDCNFESVAGPAIHVRQNSEL